MLPTLTRFCIAIALCPASAWARYEEFAGEDGGTAVPEWQLPLYLGAGLLMWAGVVWGQGWRERAWPVGLAALALLAWAVWGLDGIGAVAIAAFVLALARNVRWRKKP